MFQDLFSLLRQPPDDLPGWCAWLDRLDKQTETLTAEVRTLGRLANEAESRSGSLSVLVRQFAEQVQSVRAELKQLAPWVALLDGIGGATPPLLDADALLQQLRKVPRLVDFEEGENPLEAALDGAKGTERLDALRDAVKGSAAGALLRRCGDLADRAEQTARAMDFHFLYKPDRRLFAIGYQAPLERLDNACYDLLASEARLASFLAIARGDVPPRHWFHLGRSATRIDGRPCLLSWGGTMFEYLMPSLLMRAYPNTLLAESCEAAVQQQKEYGAATRRPLGDLRIRLQQPVRQLRLPIPVVRRAGPGTEARPGPGPGRRPLRHGAGGVGAAGGGAGEFPPSRPRRGLRAVRLL